MAVDIGHWAGAPGVISASGRPELEFNRDLAVEVRAALEARGLEVRVIENLPQMHERVQRAAGADLLLSLHHDSVGRERLHEADAYSGFSLFISRFNPQAEKSRACASAIGAELRAAGHAPSRYHAEPIPGENRPFADETNGVHYFDRLAVVSGASVPALLIEAGVIVNRAEEKKMREPAVQRQIAVAIAEGARKCLR